MRVGEGAMTESQLLGGAIGVLALALGVILSQGIFRK